MTVIKIFDWPSALCFTRADVGYTHASVAGRAYFTGRPQGETLALPKRMMVDAGGTLEYSGLVEVVRYALTPNNLIRLPDPNWPLGRSRAVAGLAVEIVWESGAEWASGATWGPYIGLSGAHVMGDTIISVMNLPPNERVFRPGDMLGVGGEHYMVKMPASSDDGGAATVTLVRGLRGAAGMGAEVEFPVRHLFQANMPIPSDRAPMRAFDWSATMTEVFKSEFSGVTFENASFFE